MPRDGSEVRLSQLWEEPKDLPSRDVFGGLWGREHAPDPHAVYTFVHRKVRGASPGLTVTDPQGLKWSIKQSAEGPVEVTHSRILSALGYHQPPAYFMPSFTLADGKGLHQERGGRFRPTIPELDRAARLKPSLLRSLRARASFGEARRSAFARRRRATNKRSAHGAVLSLGP
jgi:hypothetical protein